jgi:hypothetical protein
MEWKTTNLRTRLYVISAAILFFGLGSAALIYLTAEHTSHSELIHDFEHSKRYRHDLEVIGGKMNVMMDRFYRWFVGLWQGGSLGLTLACLTICISMGLFLFAYHLPSEAQSNAQGENRPGGENP